MSSIAVFAGVMAATPAQGARSVPFEKVWEFEIPGLNQSSSPVIADIDSDGRNEIVFGHRDGKLRAYEGDGSLKWEAEAVPGASQEACQQQSTPSAIDLCPAVADIDGDGVLEVVVGVGSASLQARDQNGSVIAFDGRTGRIKWTFKQSRDTGNIWDGATPDLDGWCEATYATPAIGDVDGNGAVDIVFGSYDFYIWAIDGSGNPLPGFPLNNDDTVWSSPALFDVDNDGDVEIFIGGDSTPAGYVDHLGGIFRAIDYQHEAPVILWTRFANDVFHSSPAIGDINGDGRFEAVTGTGDNWFIKCKQRANPLCGPDDGSDNSKVWAFHLDDGSDVSGWPVRAAGTVWSSPSIGDVDADGRPEVVVGSDDKRVYAWNGDGSVRWSTKPQFAHLGDGDIVRGAPVIADLDGDADQDVAIGTSRGLALLDGRSGAELEANVFWKGRMSFAYSQQTAPAVGEFNGQRYIVFHDELPRPDQDPRSCLQAFANGLTRCLADVSPRADPRRHRVDLRIWPCSVGRGSDRWTNSVLHRAGAVAGRCWRHRCGRCAMRLAPHPGEPRRNSVVHVEGARLSRRRTSSFQRCGWQRVEPGRGVDVRQ